MPDLRELYQEVILDHHKRPRNFHKLEDANRHAEGFNPLCGDRIMVYLRVEDGVVRDAGFEGSGCAISTASASLMTEMLKGKIKLGWKVIFLAQGMEANFSIIPVKARAMKLRITNIWVTR
jgi:nitrogen fixation NifU-like protein